MNDIYKHIITLLDDTSFPPLVMLDGEWGEGKTYYTKETLIPELERQEKKCVFFSLTGLSSISDFKDRLLSASLLNTPLDAEQGIAISGIFGTLIKSFSGDSGGTIASLLGGATGLIKESLLSKLKDKYIIIDDLDRVTNCDLSNLIIGECLQLTDTGNLKFIFIVNDKMSLANKDLKEKVFSGVVKLNRTVFDAIEIAFSKYDWFDNYKDKIVKIIEDKGLKNIRVLKRCSKNINVIFELLKSDENFDLTACMSVVIDGVIIITYYHYVKGLGESEIWTNSGYSLPKKDKVMEYSDLKQMRYFLTKEFISYCVGGDNWNVSLEDLGRLPEKKCPIDTFLFANNFQLDDTEFRDNVDTLHKFVFHKQNVPFSKWFEAAYYYYFLHKHDFLLGDMPELSESFDDLVESKTFDYSDLDGRTHSLKINSEDNYIYEKYKIQKDLYRKNKEQIIKIDIFDRMKDSWVNVDIEIYKSHQLTPFFNQFSVEQLKECVDNWHNKDLLLFNDFISHRFKVSNIKNYLSEELSIVGQLHTVVKDIHKNENQGRRKGSLGFLLHNLDAAKKSIAQEDRANS
jgi:hypothetical protein